MIVILVQFVSPFWLPFWAPKASQNGAEFRQKSSLGYFVAILQSVDDILVYLGAGCGHSGSMLDMILPKLKHFSCVLVHVELNWHTVLLMTLFLTHWHVVLTSVHASCQSQAPPPARPEGYCYCPLLLPLPLPLLRALRNYYCRLMPLLLTQWHVYTPLNSRSLSVTNAPAFL